MYFLIGLIALIVNIVICVRFANIAAEKGYNGTGYFWACFFLSIIGYIMVAALPDQIVYCRLSQLEENQNHSEKYEPQSTRLNINNPNINTHAATASANQWVCSCGRANANYVSSCTCGINKRDIVK